MVRTPNILQIIGIAAFALALLSAPFLSTAKADTVRRSDTHRHAERQHDRWDGERRGGRHESAYRHDRRHKHRHARRYAPPHRHAAVRKVVHIHKAAPRPYLTAEERLYRAIAEAVIAATRTNAYR